MGKARDLGSLTFSEGNGLALLDGQDVLIFRQGFPLIGKQLAETVNGVPHDAPKHVIKIFPWIYIACLAGLDQAEEEGRCPRPWLTAGK